MSCSITYLVLVNALAVTRPFAVSIDTSSSGKGDNAIDLRRLEAEQSPRALTVILTVGSLGGNITVNIKYKRKWD